MSGLITLKVAAAEFGITLTSLMNHAARDPQFPAPLGRGSHSRSRLYEQAALQRWYDERPKDANGRLKRRKRARPVVNVSTANCPERDNFNNTLARQFITGFLTQHRGEL